MKILSIRNKKPQGAAVSNLYGQIQVILVLLVLFKKWDFLISEAEFLSVSFYIWLF